MVTKVLVLNADGNFLNIISYKRAFTLIDRGKAEVVEKSGKIISNVDGTFTFEIPKIVRLFQFISRIYKNGIHFNKKNIHLRDRKECQYCGVKHDKMTIDHVFPTSRGGNDTWENCVTCCNSCNTKKGSKTPEEAGMKLRRKPRKPSMAEVLSIRFENAELY